jgi:3-isopropylmalate dehydratase small subunit
LSFRLSSVKRQSVPWAMILCGLDVIIATSFSRSA